jgi:hypothetical protein
VPAPNRKDFANARSCDSLGKKIGKKLGLMEYKAYSIGAKPIYLGCAKHTPQGNVV